MYNEGIKTFIAGEALIARRLVKLESGTVTDPPEVVYADAGEDAIGVTEVAVADTEPVSVKLLNNSGTFEIEALVDSAIARGTSLYVGASGVVTDASSGSVIGIALETAVDGARIEVAIDNRKPTTAAGTTYADASGYTSAATVEAALDELNLNMLSVQNFIPIPLTSWMIGDGSNTVSYGGPATDPILDMANGDIDSALRFTWAAASVEEIITQISLPPNLDATADIVLHLYCSKDADANTVTLASDAYFMTGDTKVEDVTATIAAAAGETTITIAATDVPAGAQTLTIELTPSAHAGDALYLHASWIEYKAVLRTS